jgi:hypothetical protein
MAAVVELCWTRIRYPHILVHLVGEDLADGVEEGGESFGCSSHGVVDLD